jgi:hypothetical protein
MRLISIHPHVKVHTMREEVGNGVLMTSHMYEGVGEILEKGDPTCLVAGNLMWFAEVLKVFVVHTNFNSVLHSKEKETATFKAKDDGSKLFVIDVVVLFSRL